MSSRLIREVGKQAVFLCVSAYSLGHVNACARVGQTHIGRVDASRSSRPSLKTSPHLSDVAALAELLPGRYRSSSAARRNVIVVKAVAGGKPTVDERGLRTQAGKRIRA